MNIAILLTCHNRKSHTVKCLEALINAVNNTPFMVQYQIFLTDDGSTDLTSEAVLEFNSDIIVLKGNGSLFWAGGMRNSWIEALKSNFDSFLLLNDDTIVNDSFFIIIQKSLKDCVNRYSKIGILVGSTFDLNSGLFSYGGYKLISRFKVNYTKVLPSNQIQECDLGNGNIMFVHKDVFLKLGILADCYIHGVADFDYTLLAKKYGIPVVVMPGYLGSCTNDKKNIDKIEVISQMRTLKERYFYLMSPTGLAFKDNLFFQIRFFPYRLFFVLPGFIFKLFVPKLYKFINRKVGR